MTEKTVSQGKRKPRKAAGYDGYDASLEPLVLSTLLSGNPADWQLRLAIRELHNTVFENVEKEITHNPYSREERERDCVRRGDVEGLRLVQKERYPERYGKLSEDPVRQEINMGIVTVTLASRAAIEGGLHYETAFYLSDICVQRLDKCRSAEEALALASGAEMLYTHLVREQLERKEGRLPPQKNRHVSRCKDYIFAHLHEKLTVRQIAAAVGLEPNYLSALFHRCEKIPLKQFILNEKLRLAKNMLTYSDDDYSRIAASLGFSSQSHMGAEFKKATGMTLREYRMANTTDDFVRESMEGKRISDPDRGRPERGKDTEPDVLKK